MPGCAAVGCNNRSEKGYMMKCFPRNPKLRKVWQERVARADWEPSNNSFLCHVHFKPQEFSITQSGRIRLRKNAIPSIFTVTSTRKSTKKCKKLVNVKKDSAYENDSSIEYLENDTEHSSTGHIERRDSDYQDMDEIATQPSASQKVQKLSDSMEDKEKQSNHTLYGNIKTQDGSSILISDDHDTDVDNFIKDINIQQRTHTNISKQLEKTTTKEESANCESKDSIKTEIKSETVDERTFDDSYDEIEEKLKQICDGDPGNENGVEKTSTSIIAKVRKATEKSMDAINASHNFEQKKCVKYTDYKSNAKSEIGYMLADKRENVEIIFGAESGDEKSYTCAPTVSNPLTQAAKPTHLSTTDDTPSVKEERKVVTEDIEQNFTKEEVHVIPNIRAAMKRKRRTREEIMKSIKKSIGSASEQDLNTLSNSELSDTTDKDTETGKADVSKRNITCRNENETFEGVKFTIKVTGDPEDVTDVIEELSSKTTERCDLENESNSQNSSFITSVITIQDYPFGLQPRLSKDIESEDEPSATKDQCTILKNDVNSDVSRFSVANGPSNIVKELNRSYNANNAAHQRQTLHSQNYLASSDDETKSLDLDASCPEKLNCPVGGMGNESVDDIRFQRFDELQHKIKVQENVIGKLTDQIIIYKNMENTLRNKNLVLQAKTKEVETLTQKLNTMSASGQCSGNGKKNLESKQRLIEDLSSRVNYLEEMNKKLMKTVTLESQQKRKLEGQIKQRDNRIKELNWKLEKASKYLERAEKNTNTYRRKMLNMQTVMRRKKLLDEKMSRFSEMLIESGKDGFSEKALETAMEIEKSCGASGYNKLLSCGFPLPPLDRLQKFHEDLAICNDSGDGSTSMTGTKRVARKVERVGRGTKRKLDAKDWSVIDGDTNGGDFESAETVTGTVQDIFDENNDGDDFGTNELREHFILELKAVM